MLEYVRVSRFGVEMMSANRQLHWRVLLREVDEPLVARVLVDCGRLASSSCICLSCDRHASYATGLHVGSTSVSLVESTSIFFVESSSMFSVESSWCLSMSNRHGFAANRHGSAANRHGFTSNRHEFAANRHRSWSLVFTACFPFPWYLIILN